MIKAEHQITFSVIVVQHYLRL